MNDLLQPPVESAASAPCIFTTFSDPANRGRLLSFLVWLGVLSILFFKPLFDLASLAVTSELHSYIMLIPFISLYLVWLKKNDLAVSLNSSPRAALVPLLVGVLAVGGSWAVAHQGLQPKPEEHLPIAIGAFLAFIICGCLLFLGGQLTKAIWFPTAFLFLLVPLPRYVMDGIEVFLQHASAEAAYILFQISGTPVFKDGLVFSLPGLVIQVAQECSGIRSTLVLFITSILAGQLFLRSPWWRAILTLAIMPIGIVRNAFRIVAIALLTIYVDPGTIHGPLHKKGGPIFFVLSLVAFFVLLFLLRRFERRKERGSSI